MGVLVAQLHQLAQRVVSIGSRIVGAIEIEGANRVVGRTNLIHGAEAMLDVPHGVAHRCGFHRGRVLAQTAQRIESRPRQFVRPRRFRGGRDENELLGARRRRFFEKAGQGGGPIQQAMHFPTPERVRRKADERRLGEAGNAQRSPDQSSR